MKNKRIKVAISAMLSATIVASVAVTPASADVGMAFIGEEKESLIDSLAPIIGGNNAGTTDSSKGTTASTTSTSSSNYDELAKSIAEKNLQKRKDAALEEIRSEMEKMNANIMDEMAKEQQEIMKNPALSDEEKKELLEAIQKNMNQVIAEQNKALAEKIAAIEKEFADMQVSDEDIENAKSSPEYLYSNENMKNQSQISSENANYNAAMNALKFFLSQQDVVSSATSEDGNTICTEYNNATIQIDKNGLGTIIGYGNDGEFVYEYSFFVDSEGEMISLGTYEVKSKDGGHFIGVGAFPYQETTSGANNTISTGNSYGSSTSTSNTTGTSSSNSDSSTNSDTQIGIPGITGSSSGVSESVSN